MYNYKVSKRGLRHSENNVGGDWRGSRSEENDVNLYIARYNG